MKNLFVSIGITCLVMVSIFTCRVYAEDIFPTFAPSMVRLYIPIEKIVNGLQQDIQNEVGFNFSYNVTAQLFAEENQGHIQTLAEGFSGETDRSSPWKTLTELLAAYQRKDKDRVRSLYTLESQKYLDSLLSDSTVEEKFMSYMKAIEGMEVLIGFYHKDGFVAFVNLDLGEMSEFRYRLTPFFFKQIDSQYFLSRTTLDEPITANISLYLQYEPDLSKLPAPKHGLTIEKSGTGEGKVNGSGIDCGDDCIEVYIEGTALYLKASPDEYSTFEGWLVNDEPLTGRLVMQADTTVTAKFEKIPPQEYTLTIGNLGTGDGTIIDSLTACETPDCLELFSLYADEEESTAVQSGIDCGETCSITYTEGTRISLKAMPTDGSEFVEWQIDGEIVTGPVEISEDTIIRSIFDEATPPTEELPIDEAQQPETPEQSQP
ncbi:MAG: hypothetical protein JXB18_14140 [Sedimentisphaerales bacterium]|nr:hypothetical protein [Sedimentisphaerales bacterium]